MSTVTISRRLRPLRLAFLVEPGNEAHLRRAVEASTCTWGGRYNIILPAYKRTPKRWVRGAQRQPPWREVLAGYIRTFEPDAVVSLAAGASDRLNLEEGRVIDMSDALGTGGDFGTSFGMSTMHVYRHLYERKYQFERRNAAPVMLPRVTDKAMHMFVNICFGAFRARDAYRYRLNYREALGAEEKLVSGDTLPALMMKHLTPLKVGSQGVRAYPLWDNRVRLFLMDATSSLDLIDFWNLRAFNPKIVPLPKQWLEQSATAFAQIFGDAEVQLLSSRSMASDLEHAASVYKEHSRGRIVIQSWYPKIWEPRDRWQRDHPQVSLAADEGRIDLAVKDGSVQFGLLAPPFLDAPYIMDGPGWANVINVKSYDYASATASVYPHDLRDVDKVVRSFGMRATFSSSEGLVVRSSWEGDRALWTLPNGLGLFQAWARARGHAAELSGAGKIGIQILKALGGPLGAGSIAHADIVRLIEKLNRVTEAPPIETVDNVRNVLRPILQHPDRVERRLQTLAERVFRLGLRQKCPVCGRENWYALGDLGDSLQCERCLESFQFPRTKPPRKESWCYRTHGPFSVSNYGQGAFCVALALRFFATMSGDMSWWPSVEITVAGQRREIDFGLWYQDHAVSRRQPYLVLGECKTFDRFRQKDVARARILGTLFPGSVLVFATLREQLDADERSRLTALARWGRRRRGGRSWNNPVMVLTHHELSGHDRPPDCWPTTSEDYRAAAELTSRSARLLELAVGLQRAHLGLEPDEDWAHIRAHL